MTSNRKTTVQGSRIACYRNQTNAYQPMFGYGRMNWNWKNMGLGASLVSILGSIAIYFAHDENLGMFVGLWASALLLLSDRMAELKG